MMKKIASHDDIHIFAPDNSRFSFLKSPYAAHKTFSAVDIYYGKFGGDAYSPVDGEIIDIQSFETPTPYKGRNSTEYLLAIRQGKYVIKIIHIKPDVPKGKTVSKGDRIGTFIRNGYFTFWNDPVMHVEVRKPGDYLRASNNLRLEPCIKWSGLSSSRSLELECRVEEINDRYSLLSANCDTCGDVMGFSLDGGFLDGYVAAEEGFFGIIKSQGFFRPEILMIEIIAGGKKIDCSGVAFCLYFNEPRIKLIPQKYGIKQFSEGGEVIIRIGI
ncbi:Uncharacterised protein [uncultured archaeon]|nr:Uncharacterised protein [uncultured archaeon]